ncbi:hypothetical protein [Methylorubrum rhodesianum]|jgi:hypothetical protein|uniref:hypothetical protein n=1 Tax=Methylorubrum rhodesianum TaxID=29427 RepID=UPI003745E4DE
MTTLAATPNSSRFIQFQGVLSKLASDSEEAKQFALTVNNPATFASYLSEKGIAVSASEADTVYGALRDLAATLPDQGPAEERPLGDNELDEVVGGGWGWVAIGAVAGLALGAVTGGVGLALAGAAFEVVGTATLGAVGGGLVGAGSGAAVGGIAKTIKNALS